MERVVLIMALMFVATGWIDARGLLDRRNQGQSLLGLASQAGQTAKPAAEQCGELGTLGARLYLFVEAYLTNCAPSDSVQADLKKTLESFERVTLDEAAPVTFERLGWTISTGQELAQQMKKGLFALYGRLTGIQTFGRVAVLGRGQTIPGVATDLMPAATTIVPVGTFGRNLDVINAAWGANLRLRDSARVDSKGGVFSHSMGTLLLPVGSSFRTERVIWGGAEGGIEVLEGDVVVSDEGLGGCPDSC